MASKGQIREVAKMVIACRDLCGDESEVVPDYEADYDVQFTSEEHFEIMAQVGQMWIAAREAAGVKGV